MELINYALASFIVSLGVICGLVMGKMAKEELRPGKKYFAILQSLVIFLMVVFAVYLNLRPYITVLLAFLFLVRLHHVNILKEPKLVFYYIAYVVFSILFFEASRSASLIIFPVLIFIYGLPTGSLLIMRKKRIKHAFIVPGLFFVLSLAIILLRNFLLF